MSLNSLQDDMSRRAASMAAMAKRASRPEEIQAIQKSLVAGVQSGAIQPYVGVPLIQELTKKLVEAKARMAQAVTGAGMPQPTQGGVPIAQQIMAQAAQADRSQGVESLASNLPESYAGGGIIAFEDGGKVERYQNTGFTGMGNVGTAYSATNPNAAMGEFLRKLGMSTAEFANASPSAQKNILDMFNSAKAATAAAPSATPAATPAANFAATGASKGIVNRALGAVTSPYAFVGSTGLDLSRGAANAVMNASPEQREQLMGYGADPSGTSFAAAIANEATPNGWSLFGKATDPVKVDLPPPVKPAEEKPAPAAPFVLPQVGAPKLTLPTFTPTEAPVGKDYMGITENLSKDARKAFDTARTAEEDYLRNLTKPGEETRERKFNEREAAQEKDSAITRALNLISTGFKVAGSKERTVAGALGKEGAEGIQGLIQGEAANRVAKERLADARDNFEQQKIATAKGDRSAATAAGQRAADDVRAYGQLNLQAAHYGNTEANQRWQAQNQFGFQGAQLEQTGKLGIAQLQQSAASTNAQLQLGMQKLNILKEQIANGSEAAKAKMIGAQAQVQKLFQSDPAVATRVREITKKWGTLSHPSAQQEIELLRNQFMQTALPSFFGSEGGVQAPHVNDLLKTMNAMD